MHKTSTRRPTERKRSRAAKAQTIERRAIRALKYGRVA
jgi:hypothetical protein